LNWSVQNAAVVPNTAILPSASVAIKPKQTMLPLLVVLFLVSYGLLAMLVVEQGRTIDSQRNLIRELFSDSTQLSKMKGDAARKQHAEAQANAHPQAQTGQAVAPNSVAPNKDAAKQHHPGSLRKPAPQKPPRFASDESDERRILISI
jgi:hypothetical protein